MQHNPTGRFSGLAETYARCRPSYPSDAVDFIIVLGGLGPDSLAVDVGCGTGISSRLFAERGLAVLGIEPNEDMRSKAEEEELNKSSASKRLKYQYGTAESTGLPDNSSDLVLCAQSFHWFDPGKALPEFFRILKSGGLLALMWNERDESDQFTGLYGDLFRTLPETNSVEMPRGKAGNALLESALFSERQRDLFTSYQTMDEEALVGRAFSASYAPRENPARADFEKSLRHLFKEYAQSAAPEEPAVVTMHYATSVYTAKKPEPDKSMT